MKRLLAAALIVPLLTACSSDQTPRATPKTTASALTAGSSESPAPSSELSAVQGRRLGPSEIVKAVALARRVLAKEAAATISNVTAIVRPGRVTAAASNTGHPCTSGRILKVKMIGEFPNVVVTGHPVPPGEPVPDFTVHAFIVTADARTGRPCLIGVQTAENGNVKPLPGGTTLEVP